MKVVIDVDLLRKILRNEWDAGANLTPGFHHDRRYDEDQFLVAAMGGVELKEEFNTEDELKHCSTCAHWGNNRDSWYDGSKRLRTCDCPKFKYGYHDPSDFEVADDGASIENDEKWGMLTGPSFRCMHWIKRK